MRTAWRLISIGLVIVCGCSSSSGGGSGADAALADVHPTTDTGTVTSDTSVGLDQASGADLSGTSRLYQLCGMGFAGCDPGGVDEVCHYAMSDDGSGNICTQACTDTEAVCPAANGHAGKCRHLQSPEGSGLFCVQSCDTNADCYVNNECVVQLDGISLCLPNPPADGGI